MQNKISLTMAGAVVKFLKNQYVARDGVEHRLINGVFGIFGHGNVAGIGQALEEFGGLELPYYQPKNEQAMVHSAIAFSKARRGLGTFACTTSIGPGATNLITGAATATINRLPVLLLPGDIFANRSVSPVLQQLENSNSQDMSVNDCFRPVSRYWDRINRPEQILQALPYAMSLLSRPETAGAVTICLPQDVQGEAFEYPLSFFEKRTYINYRNLPTEEELKGAVQLIKSSVKPMIVAGGGVFYSDAGTALKEFVKTTHIPVTLTQAGKSLNEADSNFYLGAVGTTGTLAANKIATETDLVIVLGSRLSDFTTASKTQFQNPKVKFLAINVNTLDAGKNGALGLVADIKVTLEALTKSLGSYKISADYEQKILEVAEKWKITRSEIIEVKSKGKDLLTQPEVIGLLNSNIASDSVIVHAAGGLPGDLHKLWVTTSEGNYHSEYGYSCMGYEIAGALGVKMANPKREVYSVLGDGSYLMLNHEIVTSIQEGIKLNLVLLDNHGYQCIHGLQKSCGGRSFGNEFRHRNSENQRLEGETLTVDFVLNAQSLGAEVFSATNKESFIEALEKSKQSTKTCLIYIPLREGTAVPSYSWWDVPISEETTEAAVKTARKKYEEALTKKQFYY
jgi:3D-(3,5/4)-trihydroxycyclohexane-1,2-dione acylhydrolase (decyclizing)